MKIALCTAILLSTAAMPMLAAPGPDTAYQAMHTVGSIRGQDSLKHVIQVQGRGGVPQPTLWQIVLDDPTARGGIRQIDVAHGKIVGEHTPVSTYAGSSAEALIDLTKLNLDSSGAFTVAEREAQHTHLGFDSVDYTLRKGDGPDAVPIWAVHMMDEQHRTVGTILVAADNGAIVHSDTDTAQPPKPAPDYTVQETDHDNLYSPDSEPAPVRQEDSSDTEDTHGLRIGHRIKTAILGAGESLKNFVTGQSSDH